VTLLTLIRKSSYQDSVALLTLARELRAGAGVREAAALMATVANKALLAEAGLLTAEAEAAGPNDLVVAIQADTAADGESARTRAEALLLSRRARAQAAGRLRPRTLESATRRLPGANLALISVPGAFAAAEARKALGLGLSVMLFSDNVALDDEVRLKRLAVDRGLWLMGPDCGTAHLNGVPLGFANVVPRGRVGIVAASGTGLQQVATLLAAGGEGISHAVGVGGRDMCEEVGGLMTLAGLDALGADRRTELIVVIGKPPARSVRDRVTARIREIGKPAVVAMLGRGVVPGQEGGVTTVSTLEDAAAAALAALAHQRFAPRPFTLSAAELGRRFAEARRELRPGQGTIRGLYAGGTLAHEAALILEPLLGAVLSNLEPGPAGAHRVVDLGADEFTVGRAHPMLDPTSRIEAIGRAAREPDVAALLVDVVLGQGAAADPAGDIAPALEAARAAARAEGRGLCLVATVVGTSGDPQGLAGQIRRLEAAGAWVLPSNAQAARAAACIVGGEDVTNAVLGARA
jgi:FdrA protein